MFNDADIDQVLGLCSRATPGPWEELWHCPIDDTWAESWPDDFAFIAAARTLLPQLAADYRKAMEENKELRSVLQVLRFGCAVSEREAEKRYGANWRDELIEKTLAGLEG